MNDYEPDIACANARIAELEAKNERLQGELNIIERNNSGHIATALDTNEALYKAEAALAQLKGRIPGAWRLCGACDNYDVGHEICVQLDCFVTPDFACNRWIARAEEGSGDD